MSLAEANKNLKFDKRIIEANITSVERSQEELQKHLSQLPDLAHNVETFTIDGKKESSSEESH
ncbi:hypothetical protein D3C87_2137870 [compost metagenome]